MSRGKKQSYAKNARAHDEWMAGKKLGRKKQKFVEEMPEKDCQKYRGGYWEKI